MNIPFVIVLGEDELANGKIKVKDMESGENTEFDIKHIEAIKNFIDEK